MNSVPQQLRRINFINTNRCNLRCVYCPQGSHPDEYHADMTPEFFEEIYQFTLAHELQEAGFGYYGELTMIEGWWKPVRRLLDANILVSTTTNGSTLLDPDEVATMARFKYIEWSIDTHDIEILKKVRKKVDVRTIVHNFHLVRSYCFLNKIPEPQMVWTGVLTINVAHTLPAFIAFAHSNGVKAVHFNEVGVYDGAPTKQLNIVDQDEETFISASAKVDEARALAHNLGITISIAETPRIQARRDSIALGEKFGLPLFKTSTPIAEVFVHNEVVALPMGHTRNCRTPWEEFYLDPKGQVFACCIRGDVMGIAKTKAELDGVLGGDKYEKLRKSLETGRDLDPACANCILRPPVPIPAEAAVAPSPAEIAPSDVRAVSFESKAPAVKEAPQPFWNRLTRAVRRQPSLTDT